MSASAVDDVTDIATLSDAIKLIKFLKVSHKAEIAGLTETCDKQQKIIKKLQSKRRVELSYLSSQLKEYETDLLEKEYRIAKEIEEKNETIRKLNKTIESLSEELRHCSRDSSNLKSVSCDSGILEDQPSILVSTFVEDKTKHRRPSFKDIFRDLSPKIKSAAKSPKKKSSFASFWTKKDKSSTSDEESSENEAISSPVDKTHDGITDNFCRDPTEVEKEEMFDRVMARTSFRKSSKNTKYQKICRHKSKYLENFRRTCEYSDSSL